MLATSFGQALVASSTPLGTQSTCSSASFSISTDTLNITSPSISASLAYNFTTYSLMPGSSQTGSYTIDFCNVTVTYGHEGWNDTINVHVWLPAASSWNGRLQALGGGGYSASFGPLYTTQAVAKGFVAIDTDAGHVMGTDAAQSPKDWALTSPGHVNMFLLEDFASVSLHEMAVIGKAITKAYYGTQPSYSYFEGCSGGGRQALMIAEKYADDFDGILAVAPAINIEDFIPAGYWANQVMNDLGVFPQPCEFPAFTQAAIAACDGLDGVIDSIISLPDDCKFDPHGIVGQSFSCDGTQQNLTQAGASIVKAVWDGFQSADGKIGWFGLNKDALLSTYINTECSSNGTCSAVISDLLSGWLRYFIVKDPSWDPRTMTDAQFSSYIQESGQQYHAMLSAADPDLSNFRAAGGKMITWHGLADEAIPPNGTIAYYQQVLGLDSKADDFYRVFEAPGVGHCIGGNGPIPNDAFDKLVAWVEREEVPNTLAATYTNGTSRNLCPYPLQQVYLGGEYNNSASFGCQSRIEQGTPASEIPFFNSSRAASTPC